MVEGVCRQGEVLIVDGSLDPEDWKVVETRLFPRGTFNISRAYFTSQPRQHHLSRVKKSQKRSSSYLSVPSFD